MDVLTKIALSLFGIAATILLSLIAKGIIKISGKQNEQAIELAEFRSDLAEVKTKVSSLHKFRNDLEEEQAQRILDENHELKEKLKDYGRRGYDNHVP